MRFLRHIRKNMKVWQAIIIGILQGLTEFLPISSSGHILLLSRIMGVSFNVSFTLALHVATLLAVLIIMRKKVLSTVRSLKEILKLAVASLCSLIVIFALYGFINESMDGKYLIFCFLLTAAVLLVSGFFKPKNTEIGFFQAAVIGCAQGLAVMPGISRSGATVSAALALGADRERSVSFSFLLSIPIIIGSAAVDFITEGLSPIDILPFVCGFVSALISGLVAVKLMFKLSAKTYDYFALYLIALSTFLIINDLALNLF